MLSVLCLFIVCGTLLRYVFWYFLGLIASKGGLNG